MTAVSSKDENDLDPLLEQLYSFHSDDEWSKLGADDDDTLGLHPYDVVILGAEDVAFAHELYERLLRKENHLSYCLESKLDKETWQRMMKRYASPIGLLNKFHAVVKRANNIAYTAVMLGILHQIQFEELEGIQLRNFFLTKRDAWVMATCLINQRTSLYDKSVLLKTMYST